MHIESSGLMLNENATSNIISATILMLIFLTMLSSAISFTIPLLSKTLQAIELQKARNILHELDMHINAEQGSMEYRLYNGYISKENKIVEVYLNSTFNSTHIYLNAPVLYYANDKFPQPSISYTPFVKQSNHDLNISLSDIQYDFIPQPGYHRIRFYSHNKYTSYTGNFTVCIHQEYNRKRCYFNITKVNLNIKKIEMWDEEWRK